MAKDKEIKTNAMRILDKKNISYEVIQYECDEFIDGIYTSELTGVPVEQSFKTLVLQGKSRQYYVFVLPVAAEACRGKVHTNDSNERDYSGNWICSGRLQSSWNEKAISSFFAWAGSSL